ncbi:Mrp/NBP35 family ATP-binding protein [Desulfomonile tiedjei]|uniref:Iron-sulfur cluster carrier protein n=1 Tax=Desulfomonile tiedjei (strain ATCC 49306 / DSM 6799 / DCB-1) TaxID=706587 RepID=I4BZL7_DESTA|nr:Mrp/NBP35 family ATP-binding protein [Desulfomonile tiedjei]AFM22758.1 ATPase involved in chromosome partitioning [Desulfomonile tiedjei DSM 6799]
MAEKKPPLSKEELQELREELMLADSLTRIENTLMILSGKGGVGKSTVAVNLAAALAASDRQVGLLDIDIHGPSIPTLLKLEGASVQGQSQRGMSPIQYNNNLKVMSVEFVLKDQAHEAVIWRGPMKHRLIKQFIAEVDWGNLDFLIVDAPPGTGDEPLSICQMAPPRSRAIIVTTPQKLALQDVKKSIRFCRAVEMPIFGIVENMSGFVCSNCGTEHELFKSGGGERLARETGFKFLGRIPLDPRLVTASDEGKPFVLEYPTSAAAKAFDRMIEPILALSPPRMKKH